MIEVSVNGKPERFETRISVEMLINKLGLSGKRIAVERNEEIVPKSEHADTLLENGDVLEVVAAIGGG